MNLNPTSLHLGLTIDTTSATNDEYFVRRFAILPIGNQTTDTNTTTAAAAAGTNENHSSIHGNLIAYGGNDGSIVLLSSSTSQTLSSTPPQVGRRFSERVRAVDASYDGTRVAVGFQDGSISIFAYPKLSNTANIHPFLKLLLRQDEDDHRNSDDDDDTFGLSQLQSSNHPEDNDDDDKEELCFVGPRFSTPIRSLAFAPWSYQLSCASEDSTEDGMVFGSIDVTLLQKPLPPMISVSTGTLNKDTPGQRGLAYSLSSLFSSNNNHKNNYLATLDLRGTVRVWTLQESLSTEYVLCHSERCIHTVDIGDLLGSKPADQACIPVWGKSLLGLPGSIHLQLRTPTSNHEFQTQDLESSQGFGHLEPIITIAFHPNESYAITVGRDKKIILWSLKSGPPYPRPRLLAESTVVGTHIFWYHSYIYIAFEDGTYAQWNEADLPTLDDTKTTPVPTSRLQPKQTHDPKDRMSIDDHDDVFKEMEQGTIVTKRFESKSEGTQKPSSFIDDEAHEESDSDTLDPEQDKDSSKNLELDPGTRDVGSDNEDDVDELNDLEDEQDYLISNSRSIPPQPPFSPSSTPLDATRRILCWNRLGVISLLRGDDGGGIRNQISIEFTDLTFQRPIHFTDTMDFIIGSLGDVGAFFATDLADNHKYNADDDDDDDVDRFVNGLNMSDMTRQALQRERRNNKERNTDITRNKTSNSKSSHTPSGSSLYFRRFETFANQKDWVVVLPDGERALGCASGDQWVACMTNRRWLRFMTVGGNQGPIVWLPGDPVTMVGKSRWLAVIYHRSQPEPDGTQVLGFSLYDATTSEELVSGPVSCLSPTSTLTWVGFSTEGSLLAMDSMGMLSMLTVIPKPDGHQSETWNWSPMLDTIGLRKSLDDSFWPVSVHEGKLICVPLKGGTQHPDPTRRPITCILPMRMPFAYGTDMT
jgi:Minichromosome loss protein, Mcl1, middle region